MAKGVHAGARTHHQDQSITLQSLRVMKTMVRRPPKPMPPELEDLLIYSLCKEIG